MCNMINVELFWKSDMSHFAFEIACLGMARGGRSKLVLSELSLSPVGPHPGLRQTLTMGD
jgi:hypothetical protein